MSSSSYTNGFRHLRQALKPIAKQYGRAVSYFLTDAFFAHIRHGVTPNQYIGFCFYAKSSTERREYYTRRDFKRFEKQLNSQEHYNTFWNKNEFNKAFAQFVQRDWIYCGNSTEEEIARFISGHAKVIVKPQDKSSGKGVHILKNEDSPQLLAGSRVLIEEYIDQHHSIAEINPSSVNSVRIYTLLDRNHYPHILSAMLRAGGQGSEVDNYHSGGVVYPLDIETGVVFAPGRSIKGETYIFHPGTEAKVIGLEIPDWDGLKKFVFDAATLFPDARMIAWDIAVLENGFEMIEANYNGDPGMMQTPGGKGKKREILKYL